MLEAGFTNITSNYRCLLQYSNLHKDHFHLYKIFFSYPSSFIDHQFQKKFSECISSSSFLPFIIDEKQFFLMRHKIMDQPTPQQSQVPKSTATADIDSNQTDDTEDIEPKQSIKKTEKKQTNYGDKLFVHCTHEK